MCRCDLQDTMLDPTQETEDEDAMYTAQYNDHLRDLATRAQAQADAVEEAAMSALEIATEKVGRALTPNEAKAIAARTLINTLYAESRRCAMCCSAIPCPKEALAMGRYIEEAEQTLYELIHLPGAQDRGETCFSRARRAGVYSTTIIYAAMPALLPVRDLERETVEWGFAA